MKVNQFFSVKYLNREYVESKSSFLSLSDERDVDSMKKKIVTKREMVGKLKNVVSKDEFSIQFDNFNSEIQKISATLFEVSRRMAIENDKHVRKVAGVCKILKPVK